MSDEVELQPRLRQEATKILERLSQSEREALLIKNWMSHDARWFMAVASQYGMEATNRLNRTAAHECGKVEARRILRALDWPPVVSLDDYLLCQEVLIGLLGPDLLEYRLTKLSENAFQTQVQRCFAHENTTRAGIAEQCECGIFARITGWFETLGLEYEIDPPLGRCLKAQGQECSYTITFKGLAAN